MQTTLGLDRDGMERESNGPSFFTDRTHLRATDVNDADLAEIAGHRVETMLARYTHPVGNSFGVVRTSVG